MENIIKQKAKEFFTNLWVQFEHLEVSQKEENIFLVKVESLDSWKLIWPHGKNLEAITHILKLMILWDLAEDKRVKIYLEVNDYLKSKDERLKDFIISKVKYVERTWEDLKMPFYSAYDRKKIHAIVADYWNEDIFTKSIWEWSERRIYICKADRRLSIDIDSVEI